MNNNLFEIAGRFALNTQEAIGEIDQVDRRAGGFASKIGKMAGTVGKFGLMAGTAIAGAGTAIAGASAKMANDFKKSMNQMQVSTGASEEEMKKFNETAKKVYANNFGESFEDIATAMSKIKQTTAIADKDIQKATENVMLLRDSFDWEADEQLRAVDSLMKNFGISSEQAFSLLAKGAQKGLDKNGDLLDTVNEYSVQFKSLGYSADEFFGVLDNGAENGAWSIDKVGDAIKEFNVRAKDGSDNTVLAFETLGLNADKMGKAFSGGGETANKAMKEVMKQISAIKDPMKQNEIGVLLFGTMWEDLEGTVMNSLTNMNDTFKDTSKTLGDMNKIKYDDLGSALQGIKRQVEVGLMEGVGEKVLPMLNQFANYLKDNMPAILGMIEQSIDFVGKLADGIVEGFGYIDLSVLIDSLISFKDVLVDVFEPLLDLIIQTGDESEKTFGEKMWMSIQKLIELFSFLVDVLGSTITAIKDFVSNSIEFLTQFYTDNEEIFTALFETIKQFADAFLEFLEAMGEFIMDFWEAHGERIIAVVEKYVNYLTTFFGGALNIFTDIFRIFAKIFKGDWAGMWEEIKNLIKDVLESVNALFEAWGETIKEIIGLALDIVAELFKNVWEGICETVDLIISDLSDGITSGFDGIIEFFKTTWQSISDFITDPFAKAGEFIDGKINSIKDSVSNIQLPTIDEIGDGLATGITSLAGFADGTSYFSGGRALVGERGPEILDLPAGSSITSNNDLVDYGKIYNMVKENGGQSVENNFNISQLVVREEADIDRIAKKLYEMGKQRNRAVGGAY